MRRECIYNLRADPIQTARFFEYLLVLVCFILTARIHYGNQFHDLTQRQSASEVANGYGLIFDGNLNGTSIAGDELIYRVVNHLFCEHIYTIISRCSVAQFPDVHTGTMTNVYIPRQGYDC